ncbi:MAG: helix-hairpin-helix domain-containing protein, partial [Clostridia bacterium]|nr:helix-hairpin-helix domain-containing protein [Clostridia bacterium]
ERSAVSIARRLQDPLAELVKIEPRSIGVGQYQHDMKQARLNEALGGVVEDCVNAVGVDLNTASYSLLSYISGINAASAKNIVKYRDANGGFARRSDVLNVPRFGEKAYEQAAGFLRVPGSSDALDNTGVHPESYGAARGLLEKFGITDETLAGGSVPGLLGKVKEYGVKKLAEELGCGEPTLLYIASELEKPGRDVRDDAPAPILRDRVLTINDLTVGMKLRGTVRNVIDFGAFVDIGVHQDGLVHISEISDRFIKHPSEVLSVGDVVDVTVKSVDTARGRIGLTMKG